MNEIRVRVGDEGEVERLRDLLRSQGFQFQEAEGGDAAAFDDSSTSSTSEAAVGPEDVGRWIEELELTVRELRNLDAAKSQFLANVSHELRTPLTAIVTYGEVLSDGLLGAINDRQKEAVQSIIGSSRQLLSMIEGILMYARASARATELEPTQFHINEVVGTVHQMSGSLIRKKKLEFEARISDELPWAQADRDKVIHILGNLVGNAIEFTPPEGRIEIEAKRLPDSPGWLLVAVSDTGIGIDPEHHEMIFREFAQVDSSRARRHHGTGLGLAIARNFIQLHGGDIWVESRLGEGSRFCFTLPTVDAGQRLGVA